MNLMKRTRILLFLLPGMLGLLLFACRFINRSSELIENNETGKAEETVILPTQSPERISMENIPYDKYALWTNGTQLRGANTWQRIVVPEYDGEEFLGNSYIGPAYMQEDFNKLASLGANYVNLSHPGLFTERPPYVLDEKVQANLDNMIAMAAEADLFVVITFRTGPGRNDFTFYRDDNWFADEDLIEHVWHDEEAQQGWVEMWRYTAERYRDNAVVVGYDLMCEPNAVEILDEWEYEAFFEEYGGTVYDWNRWYPQIVNGIREVDADTPILVGGEGYSALDWLPYLEVVDQPHMVYMFHQYAPFMYTHQDPSRLRLSYPGRFDTDWDGQKEDVNPDWLRNFLYTAIDFSESYDVPVAVNEFGAQRWQPGADQFMRDEMQIFEDMGINYALWVWDSDWQPWLENVNGFTFRFGEDPNNDSETSNVLQDVILEYWSRNTIRPSTYRQ